MLKQMRKWPGVETLSHEVDLAMMEHFPWSDDEDVPAGVYVIVEGRARWIMGYTPCVSFDDMASFTRHHLAEPQVENVNKLMKELTALKKGRIVGTFAIAEADVDPLPNRAEEKREARITIAFDLRKLITSSTTRFRGVDGKPDVVEGIAVGGPEVQALGLFAVSLGIAIMRNMKGNR